MMDPITYLTENAVRIVPFVILGVAIALDGLRKRHKGEPIQTYQWVKTPVIGLIAGILASTQAATATGATVPLFLAVATKVVNSAWDQYLPPKFGGSNTHGFGAELDVDLRESNSLVNQLFEMISDMIDRKLDERDLTQESTVVATPTESSGTSGNGGGSDKFEYDESPGDDDELDNLVEDAQSDDPTNTAR